jgi:hypothetical protein
MASGRARQATLDASLRSMDGLLKRLIVQTRPGGWLPGAVGDLDLVDAHQRVTMQR